MEYLFYISLGLMIHVYIIYPLGLFLFRKSSKYLKRNRSHFLHKSAKDRLIKHLVKTSNPTITLLVPCYNEENSILQKIKNFKELNYPKNKIELVFLNDLSSDMSFDILEASKSDRIHVHHNSERRGKVQSIANYVRQIKSDLTIISDCAAELNPNALKKMIKHFHDSSVGIVGGVYQVISSEQDCRSTGEGLYWKYEMGMRESESLLQTTTHVSGQIYIAKTSILKDIKWDSDIINDDIFIPLEAIIQGYTVEVETGAKATEKVDITTQNELKRRRRIANGNFQTIRIIPRLLMKFHLFTVFQLFSHKYLRNLSVGFMGVIFFSNLFLLGNLTWNIIFVMQIVFYSLAFLPYLTKSKLPKFFAIPHYFFSSNVGGILGFFDFISSKQNYTWEKLDISWKGQ